MAGSMRALSHRGLYFPQSLTVVSRRYIHPMSDNVSPTAELQMSAEGSKNPTFWDYVKANIGLIVVAAGILTVGIFVGAVVGRLFPPFELDHQFWHDFLSGPPMAGAFAILAASIAYKAATRSVKASRDHAEEEEWWNRAEWGIGLAISDKPEQKLVGLEAISVLLDGATKREDALIEAAARAIKDQQTGAAVDRLDETGDNIEEDGDDNGSTNQS